MALLGLESPIVFAFWHKHPRSQARHCWTTAPLHVRHLLRQQTHRLCCNQQNRGLRKSPTCLRQLLYLKKCDNGYKNKWWKKSRNRESELPDGHKSIVILTCTVGLAICSPTHLSQLTEDILKQQRPTKYHYQNLAINKQTSAQDA